MWIEPPEIWGGLRRGNNIDDVSEETYWAKRGRYDVSEETY